MSSSVARWVVRDVFRSAFGNDIAAHFATFWAKINDPIGAFDDI